MIFGFGTCSMLFTMLEELKNNLKTVNKNAKRREHRPKIAEQFSQIVQFHCKLIQLSHTNRNRVPPQMPVVNGRNSLFVFYLFRLTHEYSRLSKEIFIITFSWGLGASCAIMLMLKMKMVKCSELSHHSSKCKHFFFSLVDGRSTFWARVVYKYYLNLCTSNLLL